MIIGNSPQQVVILRLEARKSYSVALWIKDSNGEELDISNTELRLVSKKEPFTQDDNDGVIVNTVAELVNPTRGYARFNLQASDLVHPADEYPFVIVQVTDGYSSVVAKGVLEIVDNPEFDSLHDVYEEKAAVTNLVIKLRGTQVVEVTTGPDLAPGTHSFTTADRNKLASIEEGAQVNVGPLPPGGYPGNFLAKLSDTDYDVTWVAGGGTGGGLDADGVPQGYVPTANGANTWQWQEILAGVVTINGQQGDVTLDLDDLADTATRLAMTPAERQAINDLGTAANHDAEDFLPSSGIDASDVVSGVFNTARVPKALQLRGISYGTADPTGGVDGDIYFQFEV